MTGVSSLPASLDFEAFSGNTFRRAITVTQDSLPYDLSTSNVIFYVRTSRGEDPIITLTEGSGITIASNVITIVIDALQMSAWPTGVTLYYDLQVNQGSDITTWVVGKITVSPA